MKKYHQFLIIIFLSGSLFSQTIINTRKVVQVINQQSTYLNSGANATLGGKSRTYFNINLPANTVEWYYSFSVSSSKVNLYSQISKLNDPNGKNSILPSLITSPLGNSVCDVYLMDKVNCDKFLSKDDNWGGSFKYFVNYSSLNSKNGVFQIKEALSNNLCLGIKNPNVTEGITITFEVVAVVLESKEIPVSESETKAVMYGNLGWKAYEKGEYDKCVEFSKKSIELDPNQGYVYNNIGLVQLIKGDYIAAIESFTTAIVLYKKTDKYNYWINSSLKDVNDLIQLHGMLEGTTDVIELLKMSK